jgi:hypothetical protein
MPTPAFGRPNDRLRHEPDPEGRAEGVETHDRVMPVALDTRIFAAQPEALAVRGVETWRFWRVWMDRRAARVPPSTGATHPPRGSLPSGSVAIA